MLKRKAYDRLSEWKEHGKKPLLVYGQRQVGKTYIIKKFAEENYSQYVYADLSRDPEFRSVFTGPNQDIDSMILSICTIRSVKHIDCEDFLIILDEIQDCEEALSALKVFANDGRYKVIASGSMLGVSLNHRNKDDAFSPLSPMGCTEPYLMRSMDFEEFLWSQDIPEESIKTVRDCIRESKEIPAAICSKFSSLYTIYMITGGMPLSVEAFNSEPTTFINSMDELESITVQIRRDINRYNHGIDAVKTAQCFDSIPAQLSQTNKRFHYSRIEGDATNKRRAADRYMENLLWIEDAGYGNFVHALNSISSPIKGQLKQDLFKVYLSDTGLLTHAYGETAVAAIYKKDTSFNLGSITENAIAESLVKCGYEPAYYQKNNGDSRMEIDFVIEFFEGAVAIEVKSGKNRDSPSIEKAGDVFKIAKRIKFENSNISVDEKGVIHMPLFASSFIDMMDDRPDFLKRRHEAH